MFGVRYTFGFAFSPLALGLTLFYFALIYVFALLHSRRRIRKLKIAELLSYPRQNETEAVTKSKSRRVMFFVSIILGVAGTALLVSGKGALLGIPGAVMIVVFLYGFFISFSSGVPAFFDKRQKLKYTGTNLLVYRTLAAKLTTMGVTMATISMLFTATILSEGSGIMFNNLAMFRANTTVNYDLAVSSVYETADLDYYREYINANIPVREAYEYNTYQGGGQIVQYLMTKEDGKFLPSEHDTVLAASDYAALRKMLGYPEVTLNEGEYVIHCYKYMESMMRNYREPLMIGGQALTQAGVLTEDFSLSYLDINGYRFTLIVPDEVAAALTPISSVYAAMTHEPVSREAYEALTALSDRRFTENNTGDVINYNYYDTVATLPTFREENASMNAMLVFPLFYLALILTMVSATILTIQLLSDTGRYRRQYALLYNLGMSKEDMNRALRRKFTLFYAMPTLPPVAICLIFMSWMGTTFDPGVIEGLGHLWSMIGLTLGIFFTIYFAYIAASYSSFKRNVLPES
jgi:hypothetical protein